MHPPQHEDGQVICVGDLSPSPDRATRMFAEDVQTQEEKSNASVAFASEKSRFASSVLVWITNATLPSETSPMAFFLCSGSVWDVMDLGTSSGTPELNRHAAVSALAVDRHESPHLGQRHTVKSATLRVPDQVEVLSLLLPTSHPWSPSLNQLVYLTEGDAQKPNGEPRRRWRRRCVQLPLQTTGWGWPTIDIHHGACNAMQCLYLAFLGLIATVPREHDRSERAKAC
jgi:hypothetical protein